MVNVEIHTPFIRLDDLLKLVGEVATGGHAKYVIQNGEVTLNGEPCLMRGKKLHEGDIVGFEGRQFKVVEK